MSADRTGGIGLEYLSVFGMPLPDYVVLAARLECDFVSVNFGRPANAPWLPESATLRDSPALRRELAAVLTAHGLRLELVEGFAIAPGVEAVNYAAEFDAVARLGARSVCVVSLDKDLERTHAQFATLATMAHERGLIVTTEVGAGVIRDLAGACRAWNAVAHPAFALLIDTMHFFRRGACVDDLAALPDGAIAHVQLCDVPMPAVMESYMEEALFDRRAPGEGDLPLDTFLAQLPDTVPIGLEIPMRAEMEAGVTAEARLLRCIAATRALLAAVS